MSNYIAREEVGREPVRYVANVGKYYVAYRMSRELTKKRQQAVDAVSR